MSKLTRAQVEEMAILREKGWSYSRLAGRYGVSPGAIHYRCLSEGALSPRSSSRISPAREQTFNGFQGVCRRFTAAEDRQLLELGRSGWRTEAIAKALGRPRSSVRIRLMTLELREEAA